MATRRWLAVGGITLVLGLMAYCLGQNTGPGRATSRQPSRTQTNAFLRATKWTQELPANPETAIINSVRITNLGGAQTNRPIIISRFFRKGEIARFPQASIDGQAVPTQADVKTRWDDGSVQHAIVSIRAGVANRGAIDVVFDGSDQSAAGDALTADQMLSDQFDFGGRIELNTGSGARTVDIREMVRAGAFRYWLAGPVTTQVIVEDNTPADRFDVEFNGHKSFHPIFIATFHPGQRSVRIDFIGENTWMDRLQDITYALALRTGNPLRQPFYEKANVAHYAASRWRKTGWSGDAPSRLVIDHNLPYLISSRAVPNFDLSLSVPDSAVSSEYNSFQASDRGDLGGRGQWAKYFGATGGRPELGVFPRWDVRYLYTFNADAETVSRGNADVSGYVPIHYRESSTGRRFHPSQPELEAYGRWVSVDARPGFVSRDQAKSIGNDAARPVGPVSNGGWTPDTAHQGSFAYISYLTTGDFYYLGEILAWAAWDVAFADPGTCQWCRGGESDTNGNWGFIYGSSNTRAYGWTLRNLAHAALLAPDGEAEKTYFTDKLLNNIAVLEGRFKVGSGNVSLDSARQPMYRHGFEVLAAGIPNPLRVWDSPLHNNVTPRDSNYLDVSKTYHIVAPWMHNLIFACLGHIEEIGFPAGPLRRDVMKNLLGQLVDPDYNPLLADTYYMPSAGVKGTYFPDWKAVKGGFQPSFANRATWDTTRTDYVEFGYGYIALAAASFLHDVEWNGTSGTKGWDWIIGSYPRNTKELSVNPMWAIVPRNYHAKGSLSDPASWNSRFKRVLASQ